MKADSQTAYLAGLSDEARAVISVALENRLPLPTAGPDDLAGWQGIQADIEQRMQPACERALEIYNPVLEHRCIGGMNATLITPAGVALKTPPAIFLHGGAYRGYSARSTLFCSVPLATSLGRSVIVPDYPLAPGSRYAATVAATSSAIAATLAEFGECSMIGDSAGGGLALSTTNFLLAGGSATPRALVLLSPWTDLTMSGDSCTTLREHDPLLEAGHLAACARAYAGDDIQHPLASPLFAEYHTGFPQTLVICGSREILLSDSLRVHQRLLDAGVVAELNVYEGLHHSFTTVTPESPEAEKSRVRIRSFIDHIHS